MACKYCQRGRERGARGRWMWVSRIGESSAPSDQRRERERERERGKRDAREGERDGTVSLDKF